MLYQGKTKTGKKITGRLLKVHILGTDKFFLADETDRCDYPLTVVMYEVQEDSIRICKETESEVIS